MALDKKYQGKKYKLMVEAMRQLRFTDEQIKNKLIEYDDLNGWRPITLAELKAMDEEELKILKSYCWHDGKPRCQTIGITNLIIQDSGVNDKRFWTIKYSDSNGDPTFYLLNWDKLDTEIDNVGDGTWNYGLYKKVN